MDIAQALKLLQKYDKNIVVKNGFNNPDMYKNYYRDVIVDRTENISIGDMAYDLNRIVGLEFNWTKNEHGLGTILYQSDIWIKDSEGDNIIIELNDFEEMLEDQVAKKELEPKIPDKDNYFILT